MTRSVRQRGQSVTLNPFSFHTWHRQRVRPKLQPGQHEQDDDLRLGRRPVPMPFGTIPSLVASMGVPATPEEDLRKIRRRFDSGLSLIAHKQQEIPAVFEATLASGPELAVRCLDFSADRGLERAETKALLCRADDICPLKDTPELWSEDQKLPNCDPSKPIERPPNPERIDTHAFTENGYLHCICPAAGALNDRACQGFEADRSTLNQNATCLCKRQSVSCRALTYAENSGRSFA